MVLSGYGRFEQNEIFKSLRFIGEILSGIKYRKRRFAPANCPGMGFNLLLFAKKGIQS
jgi:hypothetical protein